MIRRMVPLFALLVLVGCGTPVPPVPAGTPVPSVPSDPTELRLSDCEDVEGVTPCVTRDEGEWRMVTSYNPYRFIPLAECAEEDGGPVLPCVWRDRHTVTGEWLVFVA